MMPKTYVLQIGDEYEDSGAVYYVGESLDEAKSQAKIFIKGDSIARISVWEDGIQLCSETVIARPYLKWGKPQNN
ncbi:MAG: hypothetical protein MRY32_04255 [Rickettsiales bacterium]|nr:hypothetical protein [Rickettsiales bacterium]